MLTLRAYPIFTNPGEILSFDGLLWTRGGKEDESHIGRDALMRINAKSLAPVIDHGDKRYMLDLGMAPPIIDFTKSFCVKQVYGSKGENVHIWDKYAVKAESRTFDGINLLRHALVNTTPDITKKITIDDKEVKVRDMEAIQMANTKIDEIRTAFTEWLHAQIGRASCRERV